MSVFPVFSKILEKHVASSLFKFVQDNLLYEFQSAFRSGHSTEAALIRLTDQILTNMDNDELTGFGVYRLSIDFRKAFDVIDHELPLKKLSIYGVCPSSVAWFKSYLSERKQFITLEKVKSEQLTVNPRCAPRVNFRSGAFPFVRQRYASSCSRINYGHLCRWFHLVFKFKLENHFITKPNIIWWLAETERWARGNKMYVNTQKTKALLVTGKHLRRRMDQHSGKLEVVTDTAEIEQVVSHKPLLA